MNTDVLNAERGTGSAEMEQVPMTHKEAVRRATNWLRNNQHCGIVLRELATANRETPDVIGFYGAGGSILIECKVSRSDFLADAGKSFRQWAEQGMGDERYFEVPPGVVKNAEEVGDWGLLEIRPHQVKVLRKPVVQSANKRAELKMLMSVMRRLEIATAVFVRQECEPHGQSEQEETEAAENL